MGGRKNVLNSSELSIESCEHDKSAMLKKDYAVAKDALSSYLSLRQKGAKESCGIHG